MDIDISAAVQAFLVEGRELAAELEQGLLRLEQGHARDDAELINALFRAAHTIKGSAGIVGIHSVARFTHHVETLMDLVRAGEHPLDDATVTLLLRCCDHIGALLGLADAGDTEGRSLDAAGQGLLAALARQTAGADTAADPVPREMPADTGSQAAGVRVFAAFGRDCLRDGMDPASALAYLGERMTIDQTVLLEAGVPPLETLQPEDCWLMLALRADQGQVALAQDAFEFFREGSQLVITAAGDDAHRVHEALLPLRAVLGDEALTPWREAGLIAADEWTPPAAAQAPAAPEGVAAPAPVAAPAAAPAAAARVVRVPAERLDEMIVQVGELVIASAGVELLARQTRNARLLEAVGALMQMVDTLQSGALKLRMVPIGETFARFQRVVRDLSRDLGKQIALEIVGGDTELDKSMVERIGDPLMHLVRNAIDHGLELPHDRLAAGKPAQGHLQLKAYHDSGNVVIEVSDDGRGLDRERILAKARERGLVGPGADDLPDSQVWGLIFEPGFSTAAQVTELSGRGVGMDVVKKSIEALRGAITLSSHRGQGTLLQLRLPLTLAIIDGFMVGVGDSRFILPLDLVVECIELPDGALDPRSPSYLNLRGEVLPYVSLRESFELPGQVPRRSSVVVVRSGDRKAGVLVDTLHGETQTVIKPLSRIFRHLRGVSGTSILGSGAIALIVDVHQLLQRRVESALSACSSPGAAASAALS